MCMRGLFRQSASPILDRQTVAHSLSRQTFFIADPSTKELSSKAARACEACYETVFPLVDPPMNTAASSPNSSSFLSSSMGTTGLGTITSLSMLPSWVSMPSLPTAVSQPQALMVDLNTSTDAPDAPDGANLSISAPSAIEIEAVKRGRVRLKSSSRPKSYHQILEGFHQSQPNRQLGFPSSPSALIDSAIEENSESSASEDVGVTAAGEGYDDNPLPSPPSMDWSSQPPSPSPRRRRKEDTARRSKRFSLPAVALHTTNVTARTTSMTSGSGSSGSGSGGNGNSSGSGGASGGSRGENDGGAMGKLRRFSLVSGARNYLS
jgi:hypothetical protein